MRKILMALMLVSGIYAHDIIVKPSQNSVAQTVKKIERIVRKKGFTVFAVIDHAAGAKKAGLQLHPETEIIFGNPKMGTKLMQAEPLTGLDLPVRILVYETSKGEVKIAYRNGNWMAKEHGLTLTKLTAKMNGALDKITTKAGQK